MRIRCATPLWFSFLSFLLSLLFPVLDQSTVLRSHRVVIDSAGDRDSSMAKCKMPRQSGYSSRISYLVHVSSHAMNQGRNVRIGLRYSCRQTVKSLDDVARQKKQQGTSKRNQLCEANVDSSRPHSHTPEARQRSANIPTPQINEYMIN